VQSGEALGGAGLQRVSENKDNPTQKTGHTTKVQKPKARKKHTENTTPGTACNELTLGVKLLYSIFLSINIVILALGSSVCVHSLTALQFNTSNNYD